MPSVAQMSGNRKFVSYMAGAERNIRGSLQLGQRRSLLPRKIGRF